MKFTGKLYGQFLFNSYDIKDKVNTVQFDFCTLRPIRKNIMNSLAPPNIETMSIDYDKDGVIDQFNISMRVKKPHGSLRL